MNNKKLERILIIASAAVLLFGVLYMFGSRIFKDDVVVVDNGDMTMPEANAVTDEIKKDTVIEQVFRYTPDEISEVAIVFTRKYYLEGVSVAIELLDGEKVLARDTYKVEGLEDQHRTYLKPGNKITGVAGKDLTLRIYSDSKKDTGMAIMMQENKQNTFSFSGENIKGTLCFSVSE